AKIITQTPYETATGIITIERDSVIHYELFQIDKNTPKLKIPIKDSYAPNVFVSVVILRGRMHNEKDASGFETGAPGLKIGYLNLKVEPKHKKLDVAAKPAKETAIPGEEVTIDLNVKDIKKTPVKGQVTLMVVDEAVLGLTAYKTPKPLSQLYAEHLLGIRTGSNLLDLPHAKRSRLEKIFPGGGMDDGDMQTKFPAELRKLFESTAYYNPNVLLDENGKASISFKLPDNLTTFRVMAVAVDKSFRVGSNDAQIQVKQPLMVQPVMPRFVYPDDKLQVEALIYNGTNKNGKIKLQAEFEGMELTSGELTNSIDLKPNSTGTIAFPVKVLKEKEVTIRYAVNNGDYNDAVEVKIPILEPGTKRTIIENKR
ncbi:MAG: hypothetical protein MI922_12465, partial [Bacteroidales bacterium]|nr:hypothetical protein [Bacteroidales bacterium]